MSVSYNIYRMPHKSLPELTKKILREGLIEQKSILHQGYQMKFYFSDKLKGNEVWWWEVFSHFFNEDIEKPYNIFYFGLLIGYKEKEPENCYLISLGKSHFYLSKFIEIDFGLNVAMRIANDENILLKKSRFFCGGKNQEASSYLQFVKGSYLPGESIEHLKTKAKETERWGGNNITFSDSIQLSLDGAPTELVEVFNDIDSSLKTKENIEFPKSEKITDEFKIKELDDYLLGSIIKGNANVIIDEIQSFGSSIIIANSLLRFKLHTKVEGSSKYQYSTDYITDVKIEDVKEFITEHEVDNINRIFVKITNETNGSHTSTLKEILSITHTEGSEHYFLKRGLWNRFNSAFMKYLSVSLCSIDFELKDDLKEADFNAWKLVKAKEIADGKAKDKLEYREYYFNEKMSLDKGYALLDRQLKKIPSLRDDGKDYNVEIADLYKGGELIAVKISDKPHDLIYNVEQSKTTVQAIKRGVLEFDDPLTDVVLWVSTTNKAKKIIDINSIQFLLAVQSWKEVVEGFGLTPKIYYSYHEKQKEKKGAESNP
ncbi:DUF6119 family protein [Pantoea cypripedii]|uniref:TIGR04141 family sporadically distributed protein n=1 Tax=Pantoea cypripedii TaxID=55209 RepID=A0A1X1ERZ3_PANCY|nr:DUF6119 family protein [Pantoea cypripedii]MBP2196809.1 uncharacterized protein (TIGR04141 family) [Pantoea cypripedii]ORM92768.1 TIGR04141 family sporadically distributed protein [Pantoea cypripedii]